MQKVRGSLFLGLAVALVEVSQLDWSGIELSRNDVRQKSVSTYAALKVRSSVRDSELPRVLR